MRTVWDVAWTLVLVAMGTAALYLPLAGLGSLAWNHLYSPFLDAVDRGDAWAMSLLAVFFVALMVFVNATDGPPGYRYRPREDR